MNINCILKKKIIENMLFFARINLTTPLRVTTKLGRAGTNQSYTQGKV